MRRGARGVTLTLELTHGPFPCEGQPYLDATTVVFVPHHYRIPTTERVDIIVHFHEHDTTAAEALVNHELREQLFASGQNAIICVPQGPINTSDSSGGKLDSEDGLLHFITEVVQTLQQRSVAGELGDAAIPAAASPGTVIVSATGGGYRVVANCLDRGGVEVSEIYLFDSLYGRVSSFRNWLLAGASEESPRQRRKLVSFYRNSGTVGEANHSLMADLEDANMHYVLEQRGEELTRAEFIRQRAVFIETRLSHGAMVRGHSNYRDCLYASCLRPRVQSEWYDSLEGGRRSDDD